MNIALRVVEILPEAKDTATILLTREDGARLDYLAGQFLTFLLSLNGRDLRRSYSLSSTPGVDPVAAITVKRVINGEVSRYLLDHLRVGDILVSLQPSGRFTLEPSPQCIFIAAGSGMGPVFSLLKKALIQEGSESRVLLISQHHDQQSILFRRQLEALAAEYAGRFRWVNILSTPGMVFGEAGVARPGGPVQAGNALDDAMGGMAESSVRSYFGRLTNFLLEDLLEELSGIFYCCGPPAFMRMVQFTLRLMGVAVTRIRKENFTVEFVPPAPLLSDTVPKRITIHAGGTGYQYEVAWPETILQAGLKHHVPMPYSCRGGRCSTCTARLLKGKIKMSINDVLTEKDLEEGLVLTCVGYAVTDLELAY